jgi:tripartite-type tricarboxylate transporter receptor subunit TctC
VVASFGLMVAARTPPDVIDKISRDAARVLAQDDLRQRFADIGVVVIGNSPAQFSTALKAEAAQ